MLWLMLHLDMRRLWWDYPWLTQLASSGWAVDAAWIFLLVHYFCKQIPPMNHKLDLWNRLDNNRRNRGKIRRRVKKTDDIRGPIIDDRNKTSWVWAMFETRRKHGLTKEREPQLRTNMKTETTRLTVDSVRSLHKRQSQKSSSKHDHIEIAPPNNQMFASAWCERDVFPPHYREWPKGYQPLPKWKGCYKVLLGPPPRLNRYRLIWRYRWMGMPQQSQATFNPHLS